MLAYLCCTSFSPLPPNFLAASPIWGLTFYLQASSAAKSCRNRMCRQGGKYAVWVDFFHGDRKICSSTFRKNAQKIPGSLALPGIFSCTPGRSRTCDLQSRSLTLYPTELRALISLFILPQQGRIVKRKCGINHGEGIERESESHPQGRKAGGVSAIKKHLLYFLHI